MLKNICCLLIVSSLLFSCTNPTKKKLAKTWKIESMDLSSSAKLSVQEQMEWEMAKEMLQNVTYVMDKDGNLTVTMGGRSSTGKYELADKDKAIIFSNGPQKEKYKITELTDTSLVLESTIKPITLNFKAPAEK